MAASQNFGNLLLQALQSLLMPSEASAEIRSTGPQAEVLRRQVAEKQFAPLPQSDAMNQDLSRYQAVARAAEDDPRTVELSTRPTVRSTGPATRRETVLGQYDPSQQSAEVFNVKPSATRFEQHLGRETMAHELLHFLLSRPEYRMLVNPPATERVRWETGDQPGATGLSEHEVIRYFLGNLVDQVPAQPLSQPAANQAFPGRGDALLMMLTTLLGPYLLAGANVPKGPFAGGMEEEQIPLFQRRTQ